MLSRTEDYSSPRANSTIGRTAAENGQKLQNQYDTLDLQAMSIMLKAEQHCVQSFSRPAPWSVALMRASTAIKYWNLRISTFTGGKTSEQTLTDIKQQAHLVDFTKTEEQARTERLVARKCLVKCLHEAEELRESELK